MASTWVFDNIRDVSVDSIKASIEECGGELEGEMAKLEKGGVTAKLTKETGLAAMAKMFDWCADNKIRCHLPKGALSGTASVVLRGIDRNYEAEEVVEALQQEGGLELMQLYMFKNDRKQFTGTVKIIAKGSKTLKQWLDAGRGDIYGIRLQVERERASKKCFNCNKYGHIKAECKGGPRCRKCGQEGHLGADCGEAAEVLATKCGYCFTEGHSSATCQEKRDDVREERKNHKKEKQEINVGSVWEAKAELRKEKEANTEELQKQQQQAFIKEMRQEVEQEMQKQKEQMQNQLQEMMKTMMFEMMKGQKKLMQEMLMESSKQTEALIERMLAGMKMKDDLASLKRTGSSTPSDKRGAKRTATEGTDGKNLAASFDKDDMSEEEEEKEEGAKATHVNARSRSTRGPAAAKK
jgi:hypothetical protein